MSVIIGAKESSFKHVDNRLKQTECSVCLTKWERETVITELACKHIFCTSCIESAYRLGKGSCPLCRQAIQLNADLIAQVNEMYTRVQNNPEDFKNNSQNFEDAWRYHEAYRQSLRLLGTPEQNRMLDRIEAENKFSAEERKRCNRFIFVALTILGISLMQIGPVFLQTFRLIIKAQQESRYYRYGNYNNLLQH